MKNSKDIISRKQGTSKLTKAKFGPGMLLQHEDMELLNSYTRDLSRLMFRSLFGCGVVCGLIVDTKKDCGKLAVTVSSGVAIACSGDPIWVPRDESLLANDECQDDDDKELWIVLCNKSKCCAPRPSSCSSGDDEEQSVCTREMLGYELRVMNKRPECVCDCQKKASVPPPPPPPPPPPRSERETKLQVFGALDGVDEVATCLCADPTLPCYEKHYAGECVCSCSECTSCDCDCVLLARLWQDTKNPDKWYRDHSVRRFVRPVLMRDPRPELDRKEWNQTTNTQIEEKMAYETPGEELAAYLVAEKLEEASRPTAQKKGKKASTLKPGLPNK